MFLPLLSPLEPFASLTLKVWVKDASSQRYLSGAAVRVFVNGSLLQSSQTEENGEVLLTVPYQLGVTLTLVASMEAYMPTQLPWKTTKMPSESRAYILLLPSEILFSVENIRDIIFKTCSAMALLKSGS